MAEVKQDPIYNHDICGLYARMQRFMVELIGSSSAGVSLTNTYDQIRLSTYLAAVESYQAWVVANPQLDFVETNKNKWPLKAPVVIPDLENESIIDLLRMLSLACEELVNSQSARQPSGLNAFDAARNSAIITKCKNFLANYIRVSDPLDLPESSPQAPMAPQGRGGV